MIILTTITLYVLFWLFNYIPKKHPLWKPVAIVAYLFDVLAANTVYPFFFMYKPNTKRETLSKQLQYIADTYRDQPPSTFRGKWQYFWMKLFSVYLINPLDPDHIKL